MRQGSPEPRVLLAVGVDDGPRDVVDGEAEGPDLGELGAVGFAADLVSVDVAPCAGVGEGEVLGGDAHHGAVLVVELLRDEGFVADGVLDRPRDRRGSLE